MVTSKGLLEDDVCTVDHGAALLGRHILHCTVRLYVTLHHFPFLHTTLHDITLHYATLHVVILHTYMYKNQDMYIFTYMCDSVYMCVCVYVGVCHV